MYKLNWCWATMVALMLMAASDTLCASVTDYSAYANAPGTSGMYMSTHEALDRIAHELKAHIVIVGNLRADNVYLDFSERPALEYLKSILKEYSYCIIYNAPEYCFSLFQKETRGGWRHLAAARSGTATTAVARQADNPRASSLKHSATAIGSGRQAIGNFRSGDSQGEDGKQVASVASYGSKANESSVSTAYPRRTIEADHDNEKAMQAVDNDTVYNGAPNSSGSVSERDILEYRIQMIQKDIDSGYADRFFEKWSQYKDPKYIYDHYKELERLEARLSALQ